MTLIKEKHKKRIIKYWMAILKKIQDIRTIVELLVVGMLVLKFIKKIAIKKTNFAQQAADLIVDSI